MEHMYGTFIILIMEISYVVKKLSNGTKSYGWGCFARCCTTNKNAGAFGIL
jgi:hypothetical protein